MGKKLLKGAVISLAALGAGVGTVAVVDMVKTTPLSKTARIATTFGVGTVVGAVATAVLF